MPRLCVVVFEEKFAQGIGESPVALMVLSFVCVIDLNRSQEKQWKLLTRKLSADARSPRKQKLCMGYNDFKETDRNFEGKKQHIHKKQQPQQD